MTNHVGTPVMAPLIFSSGSFPNLRWFPDTHVLIIRQLKTWGGDFLYPHLSLSLSLSWWSSLLQHSALGTPAALLWPSQTPKSLSESPLGSTQVPPCAISWILPPGSNLCPLAQPCLPHLAHLASRDLSLKESWISCNEHWESSAIPWLVQEASGV